MLIVYTWILIYNENTTVARTLTTETTVLL